MLQGSALDWSPTRGLQACCNHRCSSGACPANWPLAWGALGMRSHFSTPTLSGGAVQPLFLSLRCAGLLQHLGMCPQFSDELQFLCLCQGSPPLCPKDAFAGAGLEGSAHRSLLCFLTGNFGSFGFGTPSPMQAAASFQAVSVLPFHSF